MSIGTYSELQASIALFSHRNNLTAQIPTFIRLAETRLNTIVKARVQTTTTTITTVAGARSASLPETLTGIKSLSIADVAPSIDYLSPEKFAERYSTASSGSPRHYTTIGDLIYFGPTPDAAYVVDCVMNADIPPLSDAEPTNSVLTRWPNVYLFASLVELTDYTKDQAANAKWEGRLQEAISGINTLDWHAGGSLRVRSDVRM